MRARLLFIVVGGIAVLTAMLAPVAGAQPIATPPPDCQGYFNPYQYTEAAVSACGIRTFPRTAVATLPGGGERYEYRVEGIPYRYDVPPAGFDTLTTSNARLEEYGLPTRPTEPEALAVWEQQAANMHVVTPPPFLVVLDARADTVDSENWSGYAVTGSAGEFTHAEAWYYEPEFKYSKCSENSEVTWAGIGGYYENSKALGQDGTLYKIPHAENHQAWTEVAPEQEIIAQNLVADPGYEFDASTKWLGKSYRMYMYNYYGGETLTVEVPIDLYDGRSAEGIAERPEVEGKLTNLSNFGELYFKNVHANGTALNSFTHHGIHMYEGSTQLASPSGLESGGGFTDTQLDCS